MKATIDGRITKEQYNENMIKIRDGLAIPKPGEQYSRDKRHREISNVHTKDTGKWLEYVNGFVKWADISQNEGKILFLKADSGFGKSHVSNYIISSLQEKCRVEAESNQAYVAYYYYSNDKEECLAKCIGSIIYQFAAVDVGYATALANACEQSTKAVLAEDR